MHARRLDANLWKDQLLHAGILPVEVEVEVPVEVEVEVAGGWALTRT
jgi:hypothetical protein